MNVFSKYIKTDEIFFKHAKGERDVKGKEFHIFNEIVFLIEKEAEFASDTINQQIGSGTLVIIPKEHYHQFELVGKEEDYHRYILQFENVAGLETLIKECLDTVKVFTNVSKSILTLFDSLANSITSVNEEEQKILLKAILPLMLMELKYNTDATGITVSQDDPVIQKVLNYINQHYLDNICVDSISVELNYSKTYISHRFKKIMHTSVYNYILQKKLIHAYNLIRNGTSASDTALICGFKEYSGFYKVFKKHFGFPPSKIGQ